MAEEMALVLEKGRHWGLLQPNLFRLRKEDDLFRVTGEILSCTDESLERLFRSCAACHPQALYDKCGKNKYKFIGEFFEKSDDFVRSYVRQLSDKALCNAVSEASRLGVHIFLGFRHHAVLYFKDEFKLSDTAAELVMHFARHSEGIEYSISLDGISPVCAHNPAVLSFSPALIAVDHTIYPLKEGLGGKLITPFLSKETVSIPSRMEQEYFRKFILKSAYKADIDASGFDFEDLHPKPGVKVSLSQDIFSRYSLDVTFTYSGRTYRPSEGADKYVSLEDKDGKVKFIRTFRDIEYEHNTMSYLKELSIPSSTALENALVWMSKHKDTLKAYGIAIEQNLSKRYYIGDVEIKTDEKAVGDWFRLHISLHFEDGTVLTIGDLRQALLSGEKEYLLPSGSWFIIPESWFERFAPLMLFGYFGGDSVKVHKGEWIDSLPHTEAEALYDEKLPSKLEAKLRPYQEEGFRFLVSHLNTGHGCCLSDDMGLGKTLQAIALMLKYKERHTSTVASPRGKNLEGQLSLFSFSEGDIVSSALPMMVVCPASVLHNWKNELSRFAPSMTVLLYTGTPENRRKARRLINRRDVILTTYHTLRNDIDLICRYTLSIVVFDESQMFKNSESALYSAVTRLNSEFVLSLSGTPVENHLSELWSLMNIITPGLLGEELSFRKNFINPISVNLQSRKSEILRRTIAPYFLRRMKTDVLDNLPERQDEIVLCQMTPRQEDMYEREVSRVRNDILSGKRDNVSVLASITRLRQIASFPSHLDPEVESGKIEEVTGYLEILQETDHKVLLFSEYITFLDILASLFETRSWKYEMLTGRTSDREAHIAHFQSDKECRIFLISLKAGGVGLNLTEADYVFLLDPWWNVSAEEQAISRAWRIGQKHSIFVYRFICENTLEEQIIKLQERKKNLVDTVIDCLAAR